MKLSDYLAMVDADKTDEERVLEAIFADSYDLAIVILNARRAVGMSQEELALQAGTTIDMMSRIERGSAGNIGPDLMARLFAAIRSVA